MKETAMDFGFTQHYLLYLQLHTTLPTFYFPLAQFLSKFEINLVPISVNQLNKFQHWEAQNLLIVTPDLFSLEEVKKLRRKYLDFALVNGRYRLFHVSAFSDFSFSGQLMKRVGNYYPFRLPCLLNEVVEVMAKIILGGHEQLQWPGGTRAKIPQL